MVPGRATSLPLPVRRVNNDGAVNGCCGGDGTTATDAAIACSCLPVLDHVHRGRALSLAILVVLANVAALIVLIVYFLTNCTNQYGVLPNEYTATGDTPHSLAELQDQDGVTIIRRSMVYYTNVTFTQFTGTYWEPYEVTCGCGTCDLASCVATIPINVEYEQCNPWLEV